MDETTTTTTDSVDAELENLTLLHQERNDDSDQLMGRDGESGASGSNCGATGSSNNTSSADQDVEAQGSASDDLLSLETEETGTPDDVANTDGLDSPQDALVEVNLHGDGTRTETDDIHPEPQVSHVDPGSKASTPDGEKAAAAPATRTSAARGHRAVSPISKLAESHGDAKVQIVDSQSGLRKALSAVGESMGKSLRTTKQALRESFKKDREDLVTVDERLDNMRETLSQVSFGSKKILAGMDAYCRHLKELDQAEHEFCKFVQESAVKDLGPVGEMMRNLAECQTKLTKSKETTLLPAADAFHHDVKTFTTYVLQDTVSFLNAYDKTRREYDACRYELKNLEPNKEKKAKKYAALQEDHERLAKKLEQQRRDAMTKILLLQDHRAQAFSASLSKYHTAATQHYAEMAPVVQNSVASQKAIYADEAEAAVLGD